MTTNTLLVAVAAAITLGAASHASADVLPAGYEERTVTLRVDDVNLDSDTGAAKMLARISSAANYVCGEAGNNVDLSHRVQHRACVSATVDHALTQLNSLKVSSLYARPPRMTLAAYRGS